MYGARSVGTQLTMKECRMRTNGHLLVLTPPTRLDSSEYFQFKLKFAWRTFVKHKLLAACVVPLSTFNSSLQSGRRILTIGLNIIFCSCSLTKTPCHSSPAWSRKANSHRGTKTSERSDMPFLSMQLARQPQSQHTRSRWMLKYDSAAGVC